MQKKMFIFVGIVLLIFLLGITIGVYITPKKIIKEETKVISRDIYKDVSIVGLDDKGNGVSAILSVEVKNGNGLVLVNINNILADYLTQTSARTAAKVASNFTGVDLKGLDVIYNIKANASTIEGPSAGSAMTLATIAALDNKTINQSVFMTGTIDENGTIGVVGGIVEKAKAAKQYKAALFLIPAASYIIDYERVKKCKDLSGLNYCEITYLPRTFDLSKLLNLNIKEVKNITEVAGYALI